MIKPSSPNPNIYSMHNNEPNVGIKDVWLRPALDTDKIFAHQVHHAAYHDVIVRQFGEWDEVEQDGYFEGTWSKYPSEIIEWHGQPCGYWSVEYSQAAIYLHQFLILPQYQGKQIGSSLLQRLIDESIAKNIPIKLQVFLESEAHRLYLRMGFTDVGQSEEHIAMEFNPPSAEN